MKKPYYISTSRHLRGLLIGVVIALSLFSVTAEAGLRWQSTVSTNVICLDCIGPTQIDETANYTWTGTHLFDLRIGGQQTASANTPFLNDSAFVDFEAYNTSVSNPNPFEMYAIFDPSANTANGYTAFVLGSKIKSGNTKNTGAWLGIYVETLDSGSGTRGEVDGIYNSVSWNAAAHSVGGNGIYNGLTVPASATSANDVRGLWSDVSNSGAITGNLYGSLSKVTHASGATVSIFGAGAQNQFENTGTVFEGAGAYNVFNHAQGGAITTVAYGAGNVFKSTTTSGTTSTAYGSENICFQNGNGGTVSSCIGVLGQAQTSTGGILTSPRAGYFKLSNVGTMHSPESVEIDTPTNSGTFGDTNANIGLFIKDQKIGNGTPSAITIAAQGAGGKGIVFVDTTDQSDLGAITVGGGSVVSKILSGSASINFTAMVNECEDSSAITVTGATDGAGCQVGVPAALWGTGDSYSCFVSATNNVKIRHCNVGIGGDPGGSTSCNVWVTQ